MRDKIERATLAVEAHLQVTAFRDRKQVEADIQHCKAVLSWAANERQRARWRTRERELRAELAAIKQKENEG